MYVPWIGDIGTFASMCNWLANAEVEWSVSDAAFAKFMYLGNLVAVITLSRIFFPSPVKVSSNQLGSQQQTYNWPL